MTSSLFPTWNSPYGGTFEHTLQKLAAEHGTPLYVYHAPTILANLKSYSEAFSVAGLEGLICYAVKANSSLGILNLINKANTDNKNMIGFDLVSGGELLRALKAGADPKKCIYSGVAKSKEEIALALKAGILSFNVESEAELKRIIQVAKELQLKAPISLRVNPNVDAKSHPYISTGLKDNKFGIPIEEAPEVYALAAAHPEQIEIVGVDFHIGSQLTEISPFLAAIKELKKLVLKLYQQGIKLHHLDIGGGLGVVYRNETVPTTQELLQAVAAELADLFAVTGKLPLIVEPGRSIVANAGLLLTRVEYLKSNGEKNFAIVDAGMNDLIRPALYQSYMDIVTIDPANAQVAKVYDVVGPVCESSCFLGKGRELVLDEGALLAVKSAGAYSFTMASNYNTRLKPAEVLVFDDHCQVIRQRDNYEDCWQHESLLA